MCWRISGLAYNPSWRDHPNFRYGAAPQQLRPRASQAQPTPPSKSGMSLKNIVTSLAINTHQFQQEAKANIQNLKNQKSQLKPEIESCLKR